MQRIIKVKKGFIIKRTKRNTAKGGIGSVMKIHISYDVQILQTVPQDGQN